MIDPETKVHYDVMWSVIPMGNQHEHGNRYELRRRDCYSIEAVRMAIDLGINEGKMDYTGPTSARDFRITKSITSKVELSEEEKKAIYG